MVFSNKPTLNPDGSVPGSYYNEDYWERGAESGKGSYNTNVHPLESCKVWAQDCYNRWGPFESFLELGCGRGWNIYGLLHLPELHVTKMMGIDISTYALTTAHEEVRPYLHLGDISNLDLFIETASFDTIFSNDVLEHLTPVQAMQCLMACNRIAKKHIAHLISVGDGINLPDGQVPSDQDQSHINLKSQAWWANLFNRVFGGSYWMPSIITHGRTVEFHLTRTA